MLLYKGWYNTGVLRNWATPPTTVFASAISSTRRFFAKDKWLLCHMSKDVAVQFGETVNSGKD